MTYIPSDRDKVLKAAADLEDLIYRAKEAVTDMRERGTKDHKYAYARIYWLRRDMGHIVRTLGAGTPSVGPEQT